MWPFLLCRNVFQISENYAPKARPLQQSLIGKNVRKSSDEDLQTKKQAPAGHTIISAFRLSCSIIKAPEPHVR